LPNWKLIRYEISKVSVYIVLFSNKNQRIMFDYVTVMVLGLSLWFFFINFEFFNVTWIIWYIDKLTLYFIVVFHIICFL
jgi:hypothetical protein